LPELILKPSRERSLRLKHPWLFSGAVEGVRGDPAPGDTVELIAADGEWLARAAYSPRSQIVARVWTWARDEDVGEGLLRDRLARAIAARRAVLDLHETDAYREVHAESDGLPGIIVDRYGTVRVIQLLSAGAERWREAILQALAGRGDCSAIYERSDVDVRALEGLEPRSGPAWGELPESHLSIREGGLGYLVDVRQGQKTGFYLDQRDNRAVFRRQVRRGETLNCFAYTGAFTVSALAAGAGRVLSIDSSEASLALARENVRLNGLPEESCEWIAGDAFVELRKLRDRARSFDVVVLDPPRFAATAAQAQRAARGYKDINLLAFKILRPGGLLFTFSCSGGVSPELFQKIVAGAGQDAGVEATIVGWLGQPADHPVLLSFPEGRYLKGLICRVAG
jgi:23S rRNA (cytosine1962-C5)-methyltransferase